MHKIEIFDSTLRDGAQGEGISFSVEDKLNITAELDCLGVDYIEAGNPASNRKDCEFFEEMKRRPLQHAKLVAFGSTRRKGGTVEQDAGCQALLAAGTPVVAIFGKSWELHVREVLCTTLEENLAMIRDTVAYFVQQGRQVFYDAEHFFDGYKSNPAYALQTLRAAQEAGASRLVLCDTNGGCFPDEVQRMTAQVVAQAAVPVGIHCHNDMGCALGNTFMALCAGASHVQGTFLGIGERCGNANLAVIIPSLQLKQGYACIPPENLCRLTETAAAIAEILNITVPDNLPYVGRSAFAHKGGMHVDGVNKVAASFEHIDPALVGNKRHILLSEVAGRSALLGRIQEVDPSIGKDSPEAQGIVEMLKSLEYQGYEFESAAASFELMIRKFLGRYRPHFEVVLFRIMGEKATGQQQEPSSAMVKVRVGDKYEMTADEGDGPVHACDRALRRALSGFFPQLAGVRLIDYKVRVLDPGSATAAKVRVLAVSTDGRHTWTTVGVSPDIINASVKALTDSLEYKLMKG